MSEFTRITVPLSRDEFVTLRDRAGDEYRHPRDHARWLLRQALGLTDESRAKENPTGSVSEAVPVGFNSNLLQTQ